MSEQKMRETFEVWWRAVLNDQYKEVGIDDKHIARLAWNAALAQQAAVVPDLSECFMTAESGGGEYKIVTRFQTLANMQVAHTAMVHWLATRQQEVK